MNYERFSDRARQVMQLALQAACEMRHEWIGTEHLLIGTIKARGDGERLLRRTNVTPEAVLKAVRDAVQDGPEAISEAFRDKLPHTPRAKTTLTQAVKEADALGDAYVGTNHLLLALAADKEGTAGKVLAQLGISREALLGEQPQTMAEKLRASATNYVNSLVLRQGVFVAEKVRVNPDTYCRYRFRVVCGGSLPRGCHVIMRWECTVGYLPVTLHEPLVLLLDSDVLAIEPDPEETRRD